MASKLKLDDKNASFWLDLSSSPLLAIVRDSMTMAFPVIIAGAFAIVINNFPIKAYQDMMTRVFGERWKMFGGYVGDGTLAVLAPVMVFSIASGIAELHNSCHRLKTIHPLMVGLISFCSLMVIMEPSSDAATPFLWMGIHGLFVAIAVAIMSSKLFLWIYDRNTRLKFFTASPSAVMINAFSSLAPGIATIFVFAAFKAVMNYFGYVDIHKLAYDLLCKPFVGMGNNLGSALVFVLSRQFLWFLGIHGSNALEPVMTEIFPTVAATGGEFIFTRAFLDSYSTMGGSGNTLSLLLAFFVARRRERGIGVVAEISILPALFNINETLVFGLPIVLNPIFIIPFIATPIVLTVTSYLAILSGLVSVAPTEVVWTTPALISGYAASGNITGSLLQVFNLIIGTAIYLPFVRISDRVQALKFHGTFKELVELSYTMGDNVGASLVNRTDNIGSLSRALANDLLMSIKKNELYLEYQPQVDCRDGRVHGVEALVRWKHRRMGRIPPCLFIPLAEEIGFIDEIGLWVCDESCRQEREWIDREIKTVVMSFNVSVKQLDDDGLPEKIAGIIKKWNLDPHVMKMEVTESTGLSSDMGHNDIIRDIKMMGVNIAIDDFGMGHTSLVYLKQFPVSMIKLDGSLVKDVTTSKISMDIIATISELCRSMDIQLLAEFVETEEQAIKLKSLGCCMFQGYLYSPALSPENCEAAIRQGFRVY
ncbi:PTS lactose transporter subunit IIC [Synergistales bacterium]|nr:PTS lactose transporter subunit IIC [Synergistales bacterium]